MRTVLITALALLLAACGQPKVEPEFGAKVRAYLLENPEVLVEVSQALERKQSEARDRVLNPNGVITVVQFFDYNCGYCKVIAPEVLAMARSQPNVRFVFKDMVIFGEASEYSAAGAALARSPEQYMVIHNAFMTTKPLTDAAVDRILTAQGINPADARKRQADPARRTYLRDVQELAQEMGIDGTPAFVVGETVIHGADPDGLKAAIAAELRRKNKTT
jgi:protein-disulfide isomerase